ncbi:MAG: putative zinc-binding metallopeptidase [Rhodobacteraceae bacterium]|nr:putative zinc-binding metallopeptidase [Paracoccaceae bacterium]
MKRFSCPVCATEVHFDNSTCLNCGTELGYDSAGESFRALNADDAAQPCANRIPAGCNWLAVAEDSFCPACRHNRTVPDLDEPANQQNWRDIEQAKRYLFYSILKWNLPHPTRTNSPTGLAFDFLADTVDADGTLQAVLTGHAEGLVTLNIAEGDDAERAARRTQLGEPYRTLIGHMRHEVGHFYWELLVRDGGRLEAFREMFGDETVDYGEALKAHYANGPQPGWQNAFISSYAAAHPWEDFAETWAHYIHIVDASETAHAFGMTLRPVQGSSAEMELDANPYFGGSLDEVLADWVPLTVAINCLNRSMGQPDLYPFVLSDPVMRKLGFIHALVHDRPSP